MGGLAVWRDISLLWLILLAMIPTLITAVVFFFLIQGLHRLRQLAKQYLPIVQEKAQLVADTTEMVSHKVSAPIIGAQARAAQADGMVKSIFRRKAA